MKTLVARAALVIAATAALGACANPTGGGNVVSSRDAGRVAEVEYGVIEDARPVTIQHQNDGVGAAAGQHPQRLPLRIGQAVANIARAFGMNVLTYSRTRRPGWTTWGDEDGKFGDVA